MLGTPYPGWSAGQGDPRCLLHLPVPARAPNPALQTPAVRLEAAEGFDRGASGPTRLPAASIRRAAPLSGIELDSAQERRIPRDREGRGKVGCTIHKTTFSLTALALP